MDVQKGQSSVRQIIQQASAYIGVVRLFFNQGAGRDQNRCRHVAGRNAVAHVGHGLGPMMRLASTSLRPLAGFTYDGLNTSDIQWPGGAICVDDIDALYGLFGIRVEILLLAALLRSLSRYST